VSRELGLPCVVAVTGATTAIAEGVVVTVDGSAGTVRIEGSADRGVGGSRGRRIEG
jgi:pyruvate,water dikinase